MNIIELRLAIAANVAASQKIRTQIHNSKGVERHKAWNKKRALGQETRALLLALAFLRRRSFDALEGSARTPYNIVKVAIAAETTAAAIEAWSVEGSEAKAQAPAAATVATL